MLIFLWKEILLLIKKAFTANDFDDPNNTADNVPATNSAIDNGFGEKNLIFKKTTLHLATAFQKLMG